jgi:hypothetical protein
MGYDGYDEPETLHTMMEADAYETMTQALGLGSSTQPVDEVRLGQGLPDPQRLAYPLRVVVINPASEDEWAPEGYALRGEFAQPGDLWRWACREEYTVLDDFARDVLRQDLSAHRAEGAPALQTRLDSLALEDVLDGIDDGDDAVVLKGDRAWADFQERWAAAHPGRESPVPEGWHPVAVYCGCEDAPACGCCDTVYVP